MGEPAITYEKYLANLPPDRRGVVDEVWRAVRAKMPSGYTQEVSSKFLTFKADEEWYVALANQKNYISLYLMPIYCFPKLKAKLEACGKKLSIGKSCINFLRAEDLPLDVIGEIVSAHDAAKYKESVQRLRSKGKKENEKRRARAKRSDSKDAA